MAILSAAVPPPAGLTGFEKRSATSLRLADAARTKEGCQANLQTGYLLALPLWSASPAPVSVFVAPLALPALVFPAFVVVFWLPFVFAFPSGWRP